MYTQHPNVLWFFGNIYFVLAGVVLACLVVAVQWILIEHSGRGYPFGTRLRRSVEAAFHTRTAESKAEYRHTKAMIQPQDATGRVLIRIMDVLLVLCTIWIVCCWETLGDLIKFSLWRVLGRPY
jgi:hypothetical protein